LKDGGRSLRLVNEVKEEEGEEREGGEGNSKRGQPRQSGQSATASCTAERTDELQRRGNRQKLRTLFPLPTGKKIGKREN
jgi:hypothetical protein